MDYFRGRQARQEALVASGVGVGHKECCDCNRGRLRTTRDAVVAIGVGGGPQIWLFVETWLGGGYAECCDATGVC